MGIMKEQKAAGEKIQTSPHGAVNPTGQQSIYTDRSRRHLTAQGTGKA